MKKLRLFIGISAFLVILIVSIFGIKRLIDFKKKDKAFNYIIISEKELMDLYLDMLLEHKKFADTIFTDTSNIVEGTGYFGQGGGQKIRTSNNYTLYYAFLFTQLQGTKYMPDSNETSSDAIGNKEAFLEEVKQKALAGIRYGVYTHNSVKKMQTNESMATDSGKWWGPDNWQSSLYANGLLFAASLMWDHLDDSLKADVEKVAVAEGDRAIRTKPRNYAPGNTGAEENAWDTNGPSLAYCMFPNHKNAEKWREASIKFAMNSLARELDKDDKTVIDGKPASKWISTANLFNDYSLENHNILHPTYIMSPFISFGDSVVAYAYHGKKIPDAFKYNAQKVSDNVLKKLVYPTGEWIYPNGCDWTLNLPGKVEAFALMSVLLGDKEALMLESRAAIMAVERQKIAGDGRFVHIADIGTEREAVNVKRIMYAYLLHKYVGSQTEKSISWDDYINNHKGTTTFLDGYVISNNSLDRFASLSWKNKLMGLITPNSNEYLDNGYITHPNLPNIFGNLSINGIGSDKAYVTHKNYMIGEKFSNGLYAGFSSIGQLMENNTAITRYLSMTVLPTNAVIIMDLTKAERDVSVAAGYVVPISFQTDIISGENKVIVTEKGKDSFKAGSKTTKEYEGSYIAIDNHTTVILDKPMRIGFGDYKVSSGIGGSTLKFFVEPGEYKKGQNVNNSTVVVYSNIDTDMISTFKSDMEYLEMPDGWKGIFLKDTDGVMYYVVNNYYGAASSFEYKGDKYVPIFMDEMTVIGDVATLKLQEGMASYVGELSKYVSTDGNKISVRNSQSPNMFYISNTESSTVKVNIKFVYKGKTVTDTISVKPGQTLCVEYDGKIKTEKVDDLPTAPDKVQNIKAELNNDAVRVSWDKSNRAHKYVIYRIDIHGNTEELATLDAKTTVYTDKNVEQGRSYKYKVIALSKVEGYSSIDSFSEYISVGEYRDNTGRVNLAYNKLCKFEAGTQPAYPESLAVDDKIQHLLLTTIRFLLQVILITLKLTLQGGT